MRIVFCDIDGVLSRPAHREHLMTAGKWVEYNEACVDDPPLSEAIALLMGYYERGYHVVLCSGRSDAVTTQTHTWLLENGVPYHALVLRPLANKRDNADFKSQVINEYLKKSKGRFSVAIESVSSTARRLSKHPHCPLILYIQREVS